MNRAQSGHKEAIEDLASLWGLALVGGWYLQPFGHHYHLLARRLMPAGRHEVNLTSTLCWMLLTRALWLVHLKTLLLLNLAASPAFLWSFLHDSDLRSAIGGLWGDEALTLCRTCMWIIVCKEWALNDLSMCHVLCVAQPHLSCRHSSAIWEETLHLSVCLRGGPSSNLWLCEVFCGRFLEPVLTDE